MFLFVFVYCLCCSCFCFFGFVVFYFVCIFLFSFVRCCAMFIAILKTFFCVAPGWNYTSPLSKRTALRNVSWPCLRFSLNDWHASVRCTPYTPQNVMHRFGFLHLLTLSLSQTHHNASGILNSWVLVEILNKRCTPRRRLSN